jgi:O-antigen/teichoic acid export membrane protein
MESNGRLSHLLARNTAMNFVGQLIPLIIAVICLPFIIRELGTEAFGLLSLSLAVIGYFLLFDFGLGRATTKFVAEYRDQKREADAVNTIWLSLGLHLILGILSGFILIWLSPLLLQRFLNIPPQLLETAQDIFFILAIIIPCVILAGVLRASLAAAQRFDLINAVKIPTTSLNYIIPFILLLVGHGLREIFWCILIARILSALAYFFMCLKIYPLTRNRARVNRQQTIQLLSFGGWVAVSNFLGPIFTYWDRFLIGAILTMSAVSFYTAPYDTVTRVWILPVSLTLTLYPAFSTYKTDNQNENPSGLFLYSIKYLGILMVPLMATVIFFAPEILDIWLGQEFASNSTVVLQILALGALLNSIARIPYSLLQGIGRPDLPAKFHLLQLPVYLGLVWFLIKAWGINGAALAWTLRIGMDVMLLLWAAQRAMTLTKEHLRRTQLPRFLVLCGLYASLFVVAYFVVHPLLIKSLVAGTLHLLFAGVCWRLIVSPAEKIEMKKALRQLGSRHNTTKV